MSEPDLVNHPPHYKTEAGIEAIDVIEQYGIESFHLGNALKYLLRAGRKDPDRRREDFEKALWYLKRYQNHWHKLDGPSGQRMFWKKIPEIVDAFGLQGHQAAAVGSILSYGNLGGGDRGVRIASAIESVEHILAGYDEVKI